MTYSDNNFIKNDDNIILKNDVTYKEWVNPEDRLVLERIDKRLVEVMDELFDKLYKKEHPRDELITRIERRLYVFPFICSKEEYDRVSTIAGAVVEYLHPDAVELYQFPIV